MSTRGSVSRDSSGFQTNQINQQQQQQQQQQENIENMNVVKEDARYKQGRKFMKENKYEEAIELFSSLLQSSVETHGELSFESAQAYYEYGNALLTKEEENPSNQILNNVEPENEDDGEEEEEENEEEGEKQEDADSVKKYVEDDPEGDFQIAWESLETARTILQKFNSDRESSILLSDVHIRLGNLMQLQGRIAIAIEEFQTAMQIRKTICESSDKMLSDVYFSLAVAHIYNSSPDSDPEPDSTAVDPVAEKQAALKYYNLSRETLKLWLEKSKDTAAAEETADTEELMDILRETTDALVQEIKELNGASSSSSSTAVTQIGFGSSSLSSSATTSTGVKDKSDAAVAVNTVQVNQ